MTEMRQVAEYLGLTMDTFHARYVDSRWPGRDSFLLLGHGDGCVFLECRGKVTSCRIHEVKPQNCRDWNACASKQECQEGLAKHWQLAVDRLGRLEGSLENIHGFQSFVRMLPPVQTDEVE